MISATQSNHPLAGVNEPRESAALDAACACLHKAGMRVTKPRVAILSTLIKRQGPATIEQIHHEVAANACDLVTVYRCLAAFEEIGLVHRGFQHNGTIFYEYRRGVEARGHLLCKACGRAESVELSPGLALDDLVQDRGFRQVSRVVQFFGLCPDCQETTADAGADAPALVAARA